MANLDKLDTSLYSELYRQGGVVTITSIDIDQTELKLAKDLTGAASNRETVDLALRTLIAVRRQPAAVDRIIGRRFDADQIDAPNVTPAPNAVFFLGV